MLVSVMQGIKYILLIAIFGLSTGIGILISKSYENRVIELKEFKNNNIEMLRRCSEEGISCDFGICDECPVTTGFQMRLATKC